MPDSPNRRCPECGRKAHHRMMVECPDCHVPFALEAPYAGLTPEQMSLAISQVLRSWKLWAFLILFVSFAAWAIVAISNRVIDARAEGYLKVLQENATNRLGVVAGQISNQIIAEFKQPRIKGIVDDAARQQAMQLFSNGVRPSLDAFQDAVDFANRQLLTDLVKSSNLVTQLNADVMTAERNLAQSTSAVAVVPKPTPAKSNASSDDLKLTLGNHTVTQSGSNYFLTLYLSANSATASGSVYIMAGVYQQTARVLNFSSPTSTTSAAPTISDAGDIAKLRFNVAAGANPTLVLELNGPTIIRLISDALDTDITLPVAADKMQLPRVTK